VYRDAAAQSSELEELIEQVRASKRSNVAVAAILLGMLAAIAVGLIALQDAPVLPIIAVVAGLSLPIAVVLWVKVVRGGAAAHRTIEVLRNHAAEVVWIYARATSEDPMPTIAIGREGGEILELPVRHGAVDRAMSLAAALCPCATLGFNPERALAFHHNPASLRLAQPAPRAPVNTALVASYESLCAVLPYAASEIHRRRSMHAVLGAALLVPGLLGGGIALAAADDDERLGLFALFFVVAILPGLGLIALALRGGARHPLHRTLERDPANVRALGLAWRSTVEGDKVLVLQIDLHRGGRWQVSVPASMASRFDAENVTR
jgi:hypothetical protein